MDNLCHTLAGLALAEAGLKRKAPLAVATLVIGANLPDVDGLVYWLRPEASLGFRRGWTHGILAMAVWPLLLAGAMMLVDRLIPGNRPRAPHAAPRSGFLLVAAVGVWSHPLLDLMNVYGVRLLMPFSERWFYGDTLFIIDPWVWTLLAVGIVLARRAQRRGSPRPFRPARVALAAVGAYAFLMAGIGLAGRAGVRQVLAGRGLTARHLMVAPVSLNPLRRQVVAAVGPERYVTGEIGWRGGGVVFTRSDLVRIDDTLPDSRAAAATPRGRAFLRWARFPVFAAGPDRGCPPRHVCIEDLRYAGQRWAEVAIPVGGALSSSATPRDPEQP